MGTHWESHRKASGHPLGIPLGSQRESNMNPTGSPMGTKWESNKKPLGFNCFLDLADWNNISSCLVSITPTETTNERLCCVSCRRKPSEIMQVCLYWQPQLPARLAGKLLDGKSNDIFHQRYRPCLEKHQRGGILTMRIINNILVITDNIIISQAEATPSSSPTSSQPKLSTTKSSELSHHGP